MPGIHDDHRADRSRCETPGMPGGGTRGFRPLLQSTHTGRPVPRVGIIERSRPRRWRPQSIRPHDEQIPPESGSKATPHCSHRGCIVMRRIVPRAGNEQAANAPTIPGRTQASQWPSEESNLGMGSRHPFEHHGNGTHCAGLPLDPLHGPMERSTFRGPRAMGHPRLPGTTAPNLTSGSPTPRAASSAGLSRTADNGDGPLGSITRGASASSSHSTSCHAPSLYPMPR